MDLKISIDATPAYHPQVATRTYDGEAVIVLADQGEAMVLNESGTLLWNRIDGRRRIRELSEELAVHFGLTPAEAETDTVDFINCLLGAQAIQLAE
jgi:hypothetical protein